MSEIENLRFSIMASRDNASMLNDPLLALTIKGEFDGKTYGTTVQLPNVYGEIPAEEFVMAVNTLQETMRQIVEELRKQEMAGEKKCAWYAEYEGVCTNADSQYCAEWCPISGELGMCRFDKENNDG